jgi:uncharacterized membrane protein YcaP (DUF421 family)
MDTMFRLTMSPLELLVRGTVMYWFLLLIFRFVLRRDTGSAGVPDILFVVLLGDAAQNGMIGEGTTVADAGLLIAILTAWNYCLDWLGYHVALIGKLNDPPPLCLIRNGRILHRNLRREHITRDELDAALRGANVAHPSQVRAMYLEANGDFGILKRKKE